LSLRLQRSASANPTVAFTARLIAIALALFVAGLLLAMNGTSPLRLAAQVLNSTFRSSAGLEDLALLFTPLTLTGLAVALALKIGAWNIGAEGQFYAGALAAAGVSLFMPGPTPIVLAVMFVAGAVGGLVWILVPTLARAYADVSELITTLLLNFVATLAVYYFATGPWLDPSGRSFASSARLPHEVPAFWGIVHWGFPFAVLLTIGTAAIFHFTRWGYEVRVSGSNPGIARFAGIAFRRHLIIVMLASGAIAGIAGMLEISGTVHRLQGGISNNFGYLGIVVAVLARGSAVGVLAAAAFIALILNAGIILQTQGVSVSGVVAMTGLTLFLAAIADELSHYRIVRLGTQTSQAPQWT
jgi:ABC-type uncharacterized transport system permease subunit